ncbi:MAG: carbamoyl-phosphate synthase large subunit [Bacteriovoracia bacterium]
MPKDTSIKKILILGSGPITIGQASEFDYSGTQASKTLKAEGFEVILINSNPATIMTDPGTADRVYIEPLTVEFVEKIIIEEKPDALLPTMGGQTALNLALALAESRILQRHNVRLLGANLDSIKKAEDRELFKKTMLELGLDVAKSKMVTNLQEGIDYVNEIGLPVILRPSFTLGGEGGGTASTMDELRAILERGLFLSPTHSVLVEESLLGWKEYELEVVRDRKDNVIIVCSIENFDPMGVHTGDSITVAPAQTLSDKQYQQMREWSKKIIRAINVETGGSNIQFALKPSGEGAGRLVVIEMNPRVSRSSALASKATGFPIAKVAAKLAVGYTLDEIQNDITKSTPASFEPSIDYVVTKIPRFDFDKFTQTPPILGTQMKSVGEVMAIGMTFKESFMKAVSSIENNRNFLRKTEFDDQSTSIADLEAQLKTPFWTRPWYIFTALRRGLSPERISTLSGVDRWFLDQLSEVISFEVRLQKLKLRELDAETLWQAKKLGFSDLEIASLLECPEETIFEKRKEHKVLPGFAMVDTCAGEFEAKTPYYYSSFHTNLQVDHPKTHKKSILILGGGPNRIGQGIEFDYCCVHASEAARELGFESIMVNCNPETVSTDHDVSTRLYFEPVSAERVLSIFNQENEIEGAILQFGGQTPLRLSHRLSKSGVPILGTSVESIDLAEDRKLFADLMTNLEHLGLHQPKSFTARSLEEARTAAQEIGFPMLIRPSYVLGGRGMRILFSEESFERYIKEAIDVSESRPVLMDRYLAGATEVDVDAICDGQSVLIGGVMEHIEEAGVHSGDSACSLPPFTLSPSICDRLRDLTRILAKELKVKGLMNVQYAVHEGQIYVLEVNPRASRTIPFVSKAIGIPLAKVATKVLLGVSLAEQGFTQDFDLRVKNYHVKMPVFPFHKFPKVDVLLGPEMKSTGESMGTASDFAGAYAKALFGANIKVPSSGKAFLSIAERNKKESLEIAKRLVDLGFTLEATHGTAAFLQSHGLVCDPVFKFNQGTPNCVQKIADGNYSFVINTTQAEKEVYDSFTIRRTALERRIPYCTLITMARAYLKAIEAVQKNTLSIAPVGVL